MLGRSEGRLITNVSVPSASGAVSREHAAGLHRILALSMLMSESADEQILHFATTSIPSLVPHCEAAGIYAGEAGGWMLRSRRLEHDRRLRSALERQLATLGQGGGNLTVATAIWAFAFLLRGVQEGGGFLGNRAPRSSFSCSSSPSRPAPRSPTPRRSPEAGRPPPSCPPSTKPSGAAWPTSTG